MKFIFIFIWREMLRSSLVASCNVIPKAVVISSLLELFEEKGYENNVVTAKCI